MAAQHNLPMIRGRCLLLWLGLGFCSLALLALIFIPWQTMRSNLDQALDDTSRELARTLAVIDQLPDIEEALGRASNWGVEFESLGVSAETRALAEVRVQEHLQTLARASGAELSSIQVVDDDLESDSSRIRLRCQLDLTMDQLLDLFWRLQGARPLIFVEGFQIRSLRSGSVSIPSHPDARAGKLWLRLDLFTLLTEPLP